MHIVIFNIGFHDFMISMSSFGARPSHLLQEKKQTTKINQDTILLPPKRIQWYWYSLLQQIES